VITFDDQNSFHYDIHNNDSADFILFDSLDFPQKLAIGAITNNTPGHCSVYFEIYDPNNPTFKDTIEYKFIITEPVGIANEIGNTDGIKIIQNGILFSFNKPKAYKIISATGQTVFESSTQSGVYYFSNLASGCYFIYIDDDKNSYIKKFVKSNY
ncbi:MAG: T9SS type A sorting domain-containing protein, partial [Ignavibacteria bacterium]|nr:T9SS type A sorting domain-containing protein [Ignavibacteria bacterium]